MTTKCSKPKGEACRLHNPAPSQSSASLSFASVIDVFSAFDGGGEHAKTHSKQFAKEYLETTSRKAATEAVPRDRSPEHEAYYAATDKKHMGDKTQPGSKFLAKNLKKVEDVIALAYRQRGSLEGDDRQKFIERGASADAFQEGKRYLYVSTPGSVGVVNSSTLNENDVLTVTRTKPGVPCSLVATVKQQPKSDYAVVVLATDRETNKDMLITTFPGTVTKSLKNETIDSLEGQQITVSQARKILGSDVWVNTKLAG